MVLPPRPFPFPGRIPVGWTSSKLLGVKGIKGSLPLAFCDSLETNRAFSSYLAKQIIIKHVSHTKTIAMAPLQAIFAVLAGASLVAAAPAHESTAHRLNRRQGCFNPGTGSPLPVRSDWLTELIGDGDVSHDKCQSLLAARRLKSNIADALNSRTRATNTCNSPTTPTATAT
jgi:hypothetical protein